MSRRHLFIAVLIFALVAMAGGDYESRAAGDASPIRVAEMQKAVRDLWLGHIFLIQHVVLYNAVTDPAAGATRPAHERSAARARPRSGRACPS